MEVHIDAPFTELSTDIPSQAYFIIILVLLLQDEEHTTIGIVLHMTCLLPQIVARHP